jgi:hypothetical protein
MSSSQRGNVIIALVAQHRGDLDCAVIIAPTLGFKPLPAPLTAPLMNVILTLPDGWSWWDDELKEKVPPPYGYLRCSKHALADILRLGFEVEEAARQRPPAARRIVTVFNPNDEAINDERTLQLIDLWKKHRANLATYTFAASLKIGHDIIDPNQPDQKIDVVYPKLIELCGK